MRKVIVFTAVCIAHLAYYVTSQEPPRSPVHASAPAVSPISDRGKLLLPAPQPPSHPTVAKTELPSEQPGSSLDDEETLIDYNLKALEQLRRLPEAAPLVDEIIEFLKNDNTEAFSLDNIPADKNGLSVVDEHTLERMVGDEEIRAKWTKLMALVAEHPEAFQPAE